MSQGTNIPDAMSSARSARGGADSAAPVAPRDGIAPGARDGIAHDSDGTHPMAPGLERARHAQSITDFLTDGSLAALCDELGTLTGIPVRLIDAHGQRIRQERDQAGRTWWRSEPAPAMAEGETQIPLVVDGVAIGTLVAEPGDPALPGDARKRLENALRLVANTAGELCQFELELANRMKEVRALARLSALIVRAATPERVLEAALDSALDALGLDAGSIMVLKEEALGVSSQDEEDLALKVSRNLPTATMV